MSSDASPARGPVDSAATAAPSDSREPLTFGVLSSSTYLLSEFPALHVGSGRVAIAVSAQDERLAVVQQTVHRCTRQQWVAEQRGPFISRATGGCMFMGQVFNERM